MRRDPNTKGYVVWPTVGKSWLDTKEGGMECWLILPRKEDDSVCIAGVDFRLYADVLVSRHKSLSVSKNYLMGSPTYNQSFNLALLIGSTGQSFWSEKMGRYFRVQERHLTGDGRVLFALLTELFGRQPEIMTALDT